MDGPAGLGGTPVLLGGVAALLLLLSLPASATASEYDPTRAGHPLRIVAYVGHPLGVILDRAIFRPAWLLGRNEPFRTLFGVQVPEVDVLPVATPAPQPEAGEGVPQQR